MKGFTTMKNISKIDALIGVLLVIAAIICLFSGCATYGILKEATGTGTWTTNKPDKDESISEGFDYLQDNNNFLESIGERFFMYYVSTTPYDGWKDSDPDAAYFMGPVISATSGPTATSIFTPSEGCIMWDSVKHQFYGFDGSAWHHGGNRPPVYDNETLFPTCNAALKATIVYNDDNDTLWQCDGAGTWAKIASTAAAGVTSLTADNGTSASGVVKISGGTNLRSTVSAGVLTLNYIGSDNGTKTENIQAISCGDSNCPTTEWVGSDDFDGIQVMWFSPTKEDQVTFQWHADGSLLSSDNVTITAYGIIEDTPDDSNDEVVFDYKLSGYGSGAAYTYTAGTTTVSLRSGGTNLWTPYTTGSPYDVYDGFEMIIPAGTIYPGDIITVSISRDYDDAADDFGYVFGIFHFTITYGL